jgi:hypothetical protein
LTLGARNAFNVSSVAHERPVKIGKTSGPRTLNYVQTAIKREKSINIARFVSVYGPMTSFKRLMKGSLQFLNKWDSLLPNSKNTL